VKFAGKELVHAARKQYVAERGLLGVEPVPTLLLCGGWRSRKAEVGINPNDDSSVTLCSDEVKLERKGQRVVPNMVVRVCMKLGGRASAPVYEFFRKTTCTHHTPHQSVN